MKSPNIAIFRATFAALCLQLLGTGSAVAGPNALGLDPTLNLLVLKNVEATSSDVEGRVAVAGNASLSGYSINAHNLGVWAAEGTSAARRPQRSIFYRLLVP